MLYKTVGNATTDQMLRPIVRSSSELLVSDDLVLVSRGDAKDCGWLFWDTSRNKSRGWRDMKDCGNRNKARRFYERKRGVDA